MILEIFTVLKIHVMVFWVMALCNDVIVYQHFRQPSCLNLYPKQYYN